MIASFATQASLVVSGVLVARILGPENRGYLALLILWPSILARLGGLGIPVAIPYFLAKNSGRARSIAQLAVLPAFGQSLVLVLAHAIVLYIFLLGKSPTVRVAGLITLVGIPASLALEYGLSVLQGQQRFMAFNLLRPLQAFAYAVLVVALLLLNLRDLVTVTLISAAAVIVAAAVTVAIAISGLPPDRSEQTLPSLRELVQFGLRGLMGYVSPIETFRIDQAVVGLFLSPAALGLYVAGLAFTNLPRFVAQSVGMVAYPRIASEQEAHVAAAAAKRFFWLGIALTAPVVLILFATARLTVPFFFGRTFSDAIPVTQVLLIGAFLLAARRLVADIARGAGRPGLGTLAEVASWFWLVPAIAVLTPRMGLLGVALAFVTASGFSFIVILARLPFGRPYSVSPSRQPERSGGSEERTIIGRGVLAGRDQPSTNEDQQVRANRTPTHGLAGGFTVVITTFNRVGMLRRAVRSAFAQSIPAELIVVDDCSTDETAQFLASLEAPPGWSLRVVRNARNAGHSASMNRGLRLARGAWVKPMDDDDFMTPNCLEEMGKAIELRPEAVICSCVATEVDETGRVLGHTRVNCADPVTYVPQEDIHYGMLLDLLPIGTPVQVAFRAQTAVMCGGWNSVFDTNCDEVDLWIRLAAHGDAVLINRQLAYRTLWPQSYNLRHSIRRRYETNMIMKSEIYKLIGNNHQGRTPKLDHIRSYLRLHWALVAVKDHDVRTAFSLLVKAGISPHGWRLFLRTASYRRRPTQRAGIRQIPLVPTREALPLSS